MTAIYTFDVFTSLDGHASYGPPGDWGGYWGKHSPEFLDHRRMAYDGRQRMVFGATTFGLSADAADDGRRPRPVDRPDGQLAHHRHLVDASDLSGANRPA